MPTVIWVGHRSATVHSCALASARPWRPSPVRGRFAEDPTNEALDGASEPEHEQHQDETRADLAVGAGAARHAEERGHPDGRCGRQAMHAAVTGIAQDHSRAEEADAGEHALSHAADDVRLVIAAAGESRRGKDRQGRTQRHQRMRPQPGGFPVEITVDADQGAEQDGDQQASGGLRGGECRHRAASSCVGPSVATSPAGRPPRSKLATIVQAAAGVAARRPCLRSRKDVTLGRLIEREGSVMRIRVRWHAVGILLIALAAPRMAHAGGARTDTLRRAVSNVLLGPFDVALSPAVTAQALYANAKAANYSAPATVALELLGGAGWFFPVTAATGVFRMWSGFAEMPVGLTLLVSKSFTDWQPPPFFDVHGKPAMVSYPSAVIPLEFGVNYLAAS